MGEENIIFSKVNSIPRAAMAAQMALQHEDDNIYTLEPFYLNKSQAEREKEEREKKNKSRSYPFFML